MPAADKLELRQRLRALEAELNLQLARSYEIKVDQPKAYQAWLKSHQPFHWFIEYFGIVAGGGFDVIIGNPPYIETTKIKNYKVTGYETGRSGNVYALCVERSAALLKKNGHIGVIVPLSGFSTGRMKSYQDLLYDRFSSLTISYYSGDAHPSVLFDGVKYRLCIILGSSGKSGVSTTGYMRWYAAERPTLFSAKIAYEKCDFSEGYLRFAKLGDVDTKSIVTKLTGKQVLSRYILRSGAGHITYHRSPVFWIRSMDFEPYFKSLVKDRSTDHLKDLYFSSNLVAKKVGALINSTYFYFWFSVQGNCRNITSTDIDSMPIGDLQSESLRNIEGIFDRLMDDLQANSRRRIYEYKTGTVEYDEFYPNLSRNVISEIDEAYSSHFGLNAPEIDYIKNYDVKYRASQDNDSDEEEDDE